MLVRHSKLTIQFWAPQLPSSFLRGWHCWLFTYSRTTRISVELCMAYSGVWLSTFNWSCLQGSLHVAFRPKPSRTTKKISSQQPFNIHAVYLFVPKTGGQLFHLQSLQEMPSLSPKGWWTKAKQGKIGASRSRQDAKGNGGRGRMSEMEWYMMWRSDLDGIMSWAVPWNELGIMGWMG